jgi:hypothetical protein
MKKRIFQIILYLVILSIIGCSPVKFSSQPGLDSVTGLKFYTVKPFILVEREVSGNRVIKATVLYLPDLSNPQYMVLKNGVGARKVDIKLTEGSINTLGFSSDPNIAESLNALASLLSKGTAAVVDINNLRTQQNISASDNSVELYEVIMSSDKTILREVSFGK